MGLVAMLMSVFGAEAMHSTVHESIAKRQGWARPDAGRIEIGAPAFMRAWLYRPPPA